MLVVKKSRRAGCLYLGKGFVDHPEMGAISDYREVTFDEIDSLGHWSGNEVVVYMVHTDTGFAFDERFIYDGTYKLDEWAFNWRPKKPDAWGIIW